MSYLRLFQRKLVVWLLALLALTATITSCGRRESALVPADVPADPQAKSVVIDEALTATPKHLPLSQGARDRVQWLNNGSRTVSLTFYGAPIGTIVPAHAHSRAYVVSAKADTGTYPYHVSALEGNGSQALLRRVRGIGTAEADTLPPEDPDISVGP